MVDICICVEGEADKHFLSSYIKHLGLTAGNDNFLLFGGLNVSRIQKKGKEIAGSKNIIAVIDANNSRQKHVQIATDGLQITAEAVFTFPDNNSDGTLEDLIKPICVNKAFFECFAAYQACLGEHSLVVEGKKAEVYSYDRAMRGEGGETKRDYQAQNRYNLNHGSLNPLKKFLTSHLPKLAVRPVI